MPVLWVVFAILMGFFIQNPAYCFGSAWEYKVIKKYTKDVFEKEQLKHSGFQTLEEYQEKSMQKDITKNKIAEPKEPKPSTMKYVPQPTYGLTRYNSPPGTVELNLSRKFKFDRQENAVGVTSPDFSILVYPSIYYYANNQSTAADLFVIPLDSSLSNVDKLLQANVLLKWQEPILSTPKNIDEKDTFRTMTPIDFSPDGLRFIAKEKVGNTYDGIWQTQLWSYDFETKTARKLVEVRDAISYYWKNVKDYNLDELRWDIYPLGFDMKDPNKIIVSAFAFTGVKPKFLGTWSIDYKGERSELVSLFTSDVAVSINGFKLVQTGVVDPADLLADEKRLKKLEKEHKKTLKAADKKKLKENKEVFKKQIKEMDLQYKKEKKEFNKRQRKSGPTGAE